MDEYQELEEVFRANGPAAAFELVIRRAREEKNHRVLFGAKIMQMRHALGLPLIETEDSRNLTDEQRPVYENAFRDAAREAGELCLAGGDVVSAWPYFKAIGEYAPVSAGIEAATGDENLDRIIDIAFREGVNPRKGFELILQHHGICSAISWFGSNQDPASRQECLRLLVRTLHQELLASLKAAIAATEDTVPETASIRELIAGRDWLFEGTSYYVDSTHLASILRFTPELEDEETIGMALEMAEYGERLDPMFHFRGEPPFEDIYLDHAIHLRALLGKDVDAALQHFLDKAAQGDPSAAEVVIDMLTRLRRYDEAIRLSTEFFPDANAGPQSCPSALQLCQMARDYETLRRLARERSDLLGFAAAVVQG